MTYVDGFVAAVPTSNREIYKKHAEAAWPSRKVRDEGMKKVMADPRLQPDTNPMPFDGKRMIYGGFEMTWRHERLGRVTEDLAGDRRPPKSLSGEIGTLATLVSVPLQLYPSPRNGHTRFEFNW
jgi:hypothetical protein